MTDDNTRPEDVKTPPAIPAVIASEEGDTYHIEGHVDPGLAILAVVVELMVNASTNDAEEFLFGGPARDRTAQMMHDDASAWLGKVRRSWFRQDPDDEELTHRCEPDDEGAEPWTEVRW